ncbi:hypothetical protein [Mucilaginibacter endophyticus]|uniref:hypothetical protein n=1 Tax=Mucilaginibacter endophyticus TaxID=2675003 RepID=UPI000E0CE479|nr:hypothetical protein [Mucilaginibacter endophyticus]
MGQTLGYPPEVINDLYKWSLGASVQAEFPKADRLAVTANVGYNNVFGKSIKGNNFNLDVTDIHRSPLKAGLKFYACQNFHVQVDAGASFLLNKNETGYTKTAAFVYAPQISYLFSLSPKSAIDLGVRFESSIRYPDINGSTIHFFSLRAAYSFGL